MVFFWCICYSSSYKYRCLVGRRDADLFPLWKSHHAHRHIVGQFTFSFKVSDLHFVNCTLYPDSMGWPPGSLGTCWKAPPYLWGQQFVHKNWQSHWKRLFRLEASAAVLQRVEWEHIHGSKASEANLQWICLPTCCTVHPNRKKHCSWKSGPSSCQVNCGNHCFNSSPKIMPFLPGRIVATTYWILAKNHAILDGLVVATTRCILTRNCTLLACWVNNGFQRVGVDLLACDLWASSSVYPIQNIVQIISSPHPWPTDWKVYCDKLSSSPNCVSLGWTSTTLVPWFKPRIFWDCINHGEYRIPGLNQGLWVQIWHLLG